MTADDIVQCAQNGLTSLLGKLGGDDTVVAPLTAAERRAAESHMSSMFS